jgi:hypothetical protein
MASGVAILLDMKDSRLEQIPLTNDEKAKLERLANLLKEPYEHVLMKRQ